MKNKKKREQRVVKKVLPSYLCLVTIRSPNRNLITNPDVLKRFSDRLIDSINMRPVGMPRVDSLPCGIPGIKSYSINQPLIESILSIDTWPELGHNGYFVILLHSCSKFDIQSIVKTIDCIFPGSEVIKLTYVDHTVDIKEVYYETVQA